MIILQLSHEYSLLALNRKLGRQTVTCGFSCSYRYMLLNSLLNLFIFSMMPVHQNLKCPSIANVV